VSKNLNIPFPFYQSLAEQNSYKDYVDSDIALIGLSDRLLPFVLRRPLDPTGLANVTLEIKDTNNNLIIALDPATYLDIMSDAEGEYLQYNDATFGGLSWDITYYAELFDGTKRWFSEIFVVRKTLFNYMLLSFKLDKMLNTIAPNYYFKLYINQVLKVPEYPRFDDAEEKDGIKIYRSQILQKVNVIRFLTAPEYLVDALMMLPLMDTVTLATQNGDLIEIQQIDLEDPEWTPSNKGATALLIVKLVEYTVIKKLNFTEMGCSTTPTPGGGGSIRQGTTTLTAGVQATILFSSVLAPGYTTNGKAQDALGNTVLFTIASETTNGFKVTANANCTLNWTAIKES